MIYNACMKKICFVTSNKGKAGETSLILGIPVEVKNIELDEIQSLNLTKIIEHKAQQAFEKVQEPIIVDDSGLFVDALQGFPGPFGKFLLEAGGNELLLKMLKSETNRKASIQVVVGFHDGERIHTFFGELTGSIAENIQGEHGFGFDPVFIPDGYDKTFAELGIEEKNKISHRKKALEQFKKFLRERGAYTA